jgi:hypothetical protein
LLVCWSVSTTALSSAFAREVRAANAQVQLGNDDNTFIFAGRCPNGAMYRVHSYEQVQDGLTQSFYDYQGPAGKGTVRTSATPQTMVARICREMAEIKGDGY